MLVMVRADTHNPTAVAAILAKHLRDRDIERFQGHAYDYATKLIAETPRSNSDAFCSAALLTVV
jgi:hypothetical protein